MDLSRFSEGDYIKTFDGLFFAVKGSVHSDDLVLAILRYIPDKDGERILEGRHYIRVYDNDATTRYLRENFCDYINEVEWLGLELQSVPTANIAEIYKPADKLQEILANPCSRLERQIARFVEALSNASGIDSSSFGVSGSILIGLQTPDSDIDLNVYGESEGFRVYDALRTLREKEEWVSAYDDRSIEPVLVSRWGDTGIDLEKFRQVECDKILHGLVEGVDYFIRLLVDEEPSVSSPISTVTISAKVIDSSQGIFTPCIYRIDDVVIEGGSIYNVSELKSYRGKFTEQVHTGDRIKARGTLEQVNDSRAISYRLIMGGRGDYLLSV